MAKKKKQEKLSSRPQFLPERLLLLAALGISAYLAYHSLRAGSVPGCGPDSDCDRVLSSSWGYILGVPISILALPIYGTLLGVLSRREPNWCWITGLAGTILAAALYFTGIQALIIKGFCKFCLAAHLAAGVASVLLLLKSPLARPRFWMRVGLGAAAVLALMGAQMAFPHQGSGALRLASSAPDEAGFNTTNAASKAPPLLSIVQGKFNLNLAEVPVQGPLHSPQRMVKLFDYTCYHCRDLHQLMKRFVPKLPYQPAIVSLPLPLDASCNPYIRRTAPAHVNACEFARLALAVFYLSPAKFHQFTDWVFQPAAAPRLEDAQAYAASLVGKDQLATSLADPRVDAQIRMNADIYAANSQIAQRAAMPQLLFTTGTVVGSIKTEAELQSIFAEHFEGKPSN